ncbi:MAG: ComEC/Rec2 family competence protein, partial [Muribaculaceae bacterium]|nr:ComEC/Rec2 family competence protein [Muribaculaceae bacterium]
MPLLPLLAAFVAGIIAVRYLEGLAACWAALSAALCVFGFVRGRFLTGGAGLFGLLGVTAIWLSMPEAPDFGDAMPGDYVGRVLEVADTPYNQRIVVEADCDGGRHSLLVYYHDVLPAVEAGDCVRFHGDLRPVGEGAVVPDEFSMNHFAFRRGIVAECHVGKGELNIVGHEVSVASFFAGMRRSLSDYIFSRSGLGPEAAGMLDAMLTGNADAIGGERRDAFAGAGLAHVLALSGTHVAVIVFMVSMLFFPLRVAGRGRWETFGILVVLWGYVLLTGCQPSVVRTVIMVSAVGCGRMLRRGSNSINNLCLAALLILVFDPRALFAPGFQMSFAAVAAILLFRFELFVGGKVAWWVRAAGNWLCVCVAAVVGTGALAAWHFHEVPLYFLLANIPVGLLFPGFLGSGILLLVLQLTPVPAEWLVYVVEWLYAAI